MMSKASESARQREFFRYYTPIRETGVVQTAPRETDHTAQSSSDIALTAFAQLGALRLNAARCIISLVGVNREYILAEASRTLSLQNDQRYAVGDELWHGQGEVKTRAEVGLILTDLLTQSTQPLVSHVAVEDLQQDDRFKHLPMVTEPPHLRSLVCLPLRTPRDYVIGLYCIVDDKPRKPPNDADLQVLADMAKTTMNHLEAARVKQRHHRSERMIRALALFLDGHDSLRSWWLHQAREGGNLQQTRINEQTRHGIVLEEQANQAFGIQDGPDRVSRTTMDNLQHGLNFQRDPSQSPAFATPADQSANPFDREGGTPPEHDTIVTHRPKLPISQSLTSESPTLDTQGTSVASSTTMIPRLSFLPGQDSNHLPGKELQEALLSADVKKTFSRASNLLREAIDLDGVAFFDASIGSFGAGSSRLGMKQKAPGAHTFDSIPETTTSGSDGDTQQEAGQAGVNSTGSPASVMGYSTRSRSSLKNHADSEKLGEFPETLLRELAKRYPHGKVFNFDDDGSISTSDVEKQVTDSQSSDRSTDVESRRTKKRMTRHAEAAAVLEIIPGARSVGWFPLWDPTNERWYAGALIWTSSPTRILTPEDELTYMAAWGNSVMAEISRLAALVASRIKVDFVSSISHELRSPLHGILASVEFLQEAEGLPPLQADMVNTINSCGKTLLDTINHVLEFAKVHKKRSTKSRAESRRDNQQQESSSTSLDDISNLSVLTEEVVDSVYAGRALKNTLGSTSQRLPSVIVIVDLPRNADQTFKLNSGAFRRVLMNLFNNALKYTDSGFVKVSVSISDEFDYRSGKAQPILHLVISDSGKGISKEFIKNSLYRAFKQEDALSVGTGLGLSIVRRVLSDVGGQVDMESEVGSGTRATVVMPLKATNQPAKTKDGMLLKTREQMKGLQACIFNQGFNVFPNMSDEPTGILSSEAESLMHLRSSIMSVLEDWFEMKIQTSGDLGTNNSDVLLTVLSDSFEEKIRSMDVRGPGFTNGQCAIALCEASFRGTNFITERGIKVYYLRLPVTPYKVGHILYDAFCDHQDGSSDLTPQPATEGEKLELDAGVKNTDTHTVEPSSPRESISTNRRPSLGRKSTSHIKRNERNIVVPQEDSIEASEVVADLEPGTYKTLLVEDNDINLRILKYAMTNLQQEYTTAVNGLEAVEAYKAANGGFDVIIIDVQMPVMDGHEATRQIRRYETQEGLAPAAVVAMTGGASTSARHEAYSSGMDLFLTKPVKMSVLKEVLIGIKEKGRDSMKEFG